MSKYPTCPQCNYDHDDNKIPPRYAKCFNCGYLFSELWQKSDWVRPSGNMSYDEYKGRT